MSEQPKAAEILIVDDHPIVRLGLKQMITHVPGLSVSCEAATSDEAIRLARSSPIDLAIVDLSLKDAHGLDLIRQLHQVVPGLPVLALSIHDEALFAERALRAGARGYIMKHEAVNNLVAAIRQVLTGRIYVSDRAAQYLLESIGRQGAMLPRERLGSLTDRELEVFELIGRGLATADIASRLRVSVKTIETHRANIKSKLNLKDANDLVRHAVSWTEHL